ncbi:MAG: hypothetical protein QOD30_1502 [Actinomycetota bacterium]|jgi:hypothetical protein|nr:hypothetical protein [Actinomycetota bacterium]
MCECPSDDELFRSIDHRIDARRWQLLGIGYGDASTPIPWTYSIGLAEGFDHPELFVVGSFCYECSGHLLNSIGELVANGARFDRPTSNELVLVDRGADVPVHLRPVEGRPLVTNWFAAWHAYYRSKPYEPPPLSVVQVVLPDRAGRYPWEPGCDPDLAVRQQVPDEPTRPNRSARRRAARHRR